MITNIVTAVKVKCQNSKNIVVFMEANMCCSHISWWGKQQALDRLKQMFAVEEGSVLPNSSMEADHSVTPLVSRPVALPRMTSSDTSKRKHTGGMPPLFDEGGRITVGMADKILARLEGRKYLEENEMNLLIALLKHYSSACAKSVPEQTISEEI